MFGYISHLQTPNPHTLFAVTAHPQFSLEGTQ